MINLVMFNAFGLAKITRTQATVTATAALNEGKAVNRTLIVEFNDPIPSLEGSEFASISFGAMIQSGKKARVVVHEFGEKVTEFYKLPQVQDALHRVLELLEAAVTN